MLKILTLAILLTTAVCAFPKRLPRFSWDTPPLYIHMCNATGDFSPESIKFLTKFPMVTIEKGQGYETSACCAEDKILSAAKQIKAADPSIHTLFYYNSVLDWSMYHLHEEMLEHPERWNYNATGGAIKMAGDHSFPQPADGMLTFNFSTSANRDFWASACINMTKTGFIDGCFSDRSSENNLPGMSKAQASAYADGHLKVLQELQAQIPGVLIANNDMEPSLDGVMLESYNNDANSLQQLMDAVKAGRLVQVHAGYHGVEHDTNCTNIENTLASFLIGAGNYSYYGCSLGWYIDTWSHWNAEYDKPLGHPLAPAKKNGSIWTRLFASGTHVSFDEGSGVGKITWASASVPVPASQRNQRLAFGRPMTLGNVSWGLDAAVQPSYGLIGYGLSGGVAVTKDGGETFAMCSTSACGSVGSVYARPSGPVSAAPSSVHDYGSVSAKIPGFNWTSFSSDNETVFAQAKNGSLLSHRTDQKIIMRGLHPAAQCGHFACPIRTQGTGTVTFGNSKMLQTAIVYWGGNPKYEQATSIVAFVSQDGGYTWDFESVVANASDYLFSEEGPNEHDLALLPNGDVLAVVRMDGGDGLATHPYRNYYRTISSDQGKTWSTLKEIPDAGCARPRLAMLGGGKGPLLLSGGRQKNNGTQGPLLWVDWGATGASFEKYSLSYYHNKSARKDQLRFTASVNTTSGTRESTCYTSILATGEMTALVGYDVLNSVENIGYVMKVSVVSA